MADIYAEQTAPAAKSVNEVLNRRRILELLRTQLETERSSFVSQWRDLNDYFQPRRARFFTSDVNRGDRRNLKIIDTTPALVVRTLQSGMLSGMTSPARPWFHLITGNKQLDALPRVKSWCYDASERMADVFLKSNLYNALPQVYGDLSVFATSAMLIEEDFETVVRFYVFPIGSYCIATDKKNKIKVFYRNYRMTVRTLVDEFAPADEGGKRDWGNISTMVKALWENGNRDAWVDVCHFILPNDLYDPKKLDSSYKKFSSVYYERGMQTNSSYNFVSPGDEGKFLRDKGYDYFPVLVPRWATTGEDVYGTDCPGMIAIGDAKQLQTAEKKGLRAVDKKVDPPLVGPTSLKTQKVSLLAGDISYIDESAEKKALRPLHEVNFDLRDLEIKQEAVRTRIKKAFFEDLFLMMAEDERRQPATATEIAERKEEKLVALGPVLSQFNQDFLEPLIRITGMIMNRQGLLPPIPPEMRGAPPVVEFISIMADAMRAAGIAGIERFFSFVGQIFQVTQNPDVLDKVDYDKGIEIYGDRTTIPPGIVRGEDEANALRQQRAKAVQAQQQAAQAQQLASAGKDLSQTDTSKPSALKDLIDQSQAGSVLPQ